VHHEASQGLVGHIAVGLGRTAPSRSSPVVHPMGPSSADRSRSSGSGTSRGCPTDPAAGHMSCRWGRRIERTGCSWERLARFSRSPVVRQSSTGSSPGWSRGVPTAAWASHRSHYRSPEVPEEPVGNRIPVVLAAGPMGRALLLVPLA